MTPPGDQTSTPTIAPAPELRTGGRIEVWNAYLGSFAGDFRIASVSEGGYHVRRISDDEILPRAFEAGDLRPLT